LNVRPPATQEIKMPSTRSIVLRTRGHSHGSITRLVSPGDIGRHIKPFVFLDYFEGEPAEAPGFGFHPHSGIATLTLILSGQVTYKETTDREGVIETGGVEWMRASSGVWHTGGVAGTERIKGFQLWVAMPPSLELAEPDSQYLDASAFRFVGPARVIAGEYDGVRSIVRAPDGMTYLDVRLRAGDRWAYQPPQNHDVTWIASHQGTVLTPSAVSAGEVAVFEEATARSRSRPSLTRASFSARRSGIHTISLRAIIPSTRRSRRCVRASEISRPSASGCTTRVC
jgi:redox-sensitive bicupin YhaK (pirin superfamily)